MGITLGKLQSRLIGELDVIPASSARERINDALRDIYDEVEWGFMFTDSYIRTPEIIEGSAQVTKFSSQVVVDASILAKIITIPIEDVDLFERQFKVKNSVEVDRGFTYKIVDWDAPTRTLTIIPPYQDVDNASAQVQILKIYYKAPNYFPPFDPAVDPAPDPVIDFKRFEYITSPQFNRRLILDATIAELDRYDPYREYTYCSEPRYVVPYSVDQLGDQLFEFYPAPRFSRVLRVKYLRRGLPLVKDSDSINDIITQELIITKAKVKSYEWVSANADKLGIKSVGRFGNLIVFAEKKYQDLLDRAQKKDEELYPKAYQGNALLCPYYDYDLTGEHMGETLLINF